MSLLPAVVELSLENVGSYLVARGFVDPRAHPRFELLGGGISNTVVKVVVGDECMVVKQSLPELRVSDYWPFDRRRIFVEADCMVALGEVLPPDTVPQVKFLDRENYVLGMTCAPAGGENWKGALLSGRADLETADMAGRLLAVLHAESSKRPDLLERFQDQAGLIQGRIDPYHRAVAGAHSELASVIDREVERILATRTALVHGDFSPKNIITYPDHLLVLDFEVAHYGDPAFDVAFCLTHLILKAAHRRLQSAEYIASALRFYRSYRSADGFAVGRSIEPAVVSELGCLLLARIDGKSRVEYINDEKTRTLVRAIAADLLLGHDSDVPAVIERIGVSLENEL
jgi:5-methylthioribose kinase